MCKPSCYKEIDAEKLYASSHSLNLIIGFFHKIQLSQLSEFCR
jgi:hypothetical protein